MKATVDAVLSYNTKQDIIDKCGGPARHVEFLLQDSVDDNLQWKDTISPNHPLKKVCDYVDECSVVAILARIKALTLVISS